MFNKVCICFKIKSKLKSTFCVNYDDWDIVNCKWFDDFNSLLLNQTIDIFSNKLSFLICLLQNETKSDCENFWSVNADENID